jgi:hypothetical protein
MEREEEREREREYGGERSFRSEREERFERGREGRYRRLRLREEHQITIVTVSFVLLVFMMPVVFPYAANLTPIELILGGMILLAGAFFQSQRRFPVNITTWMGGFAMLAIGIFELQTQKTVLDAFLPILLFGGVLVGTFLTGQF